MYLYVAETKKDNDNHLTAEIIEEITQEELDDLNSAFTFCQGNQFALQCRC